jgi:hypothetical protein
MGREVTRMVRNKKPVKVYVGKLQENRPLGLAGHIEESGLELFGSELGPVCLLSRRRKIVSRVTVQLSAPQDDGCCNSMAPTPSLSINKAVNVTCTDCTACTRQNASQYPLSSLLIT